MISILTTSGKQTRPGVFSFGREDRHVVQAVKFGVVNNIHLIHRSSFTTMTAQLLLTSCMPNELARKSVLTMLGKAAKHR